VDPAPTRYVERDGAALAYQVIGDGPTDIVVHLEVIQHLDLCWTDPHVHHNFERLARLGRAVVFQRRGIGLSEPVPYVPTLEQQADDVLAVMDAVGMERALLYGIFSACLPVAMAAACAPERASALVLYNPFADGLPLGTGVLPGWTAGEIAGYRVAFDELLDGWGAGLTVPLWSPAIDTPYNRRLMGMLERSSASPATARAHSDWYSRLDLTEVLRAIQVPTHVLWQETDRLPEPVVQRVGDLVPGATYHRLRGVPRGATLGEGFTPVIDFMEHLTRGADRHQYDGRALGSLLFTDIVGSTELLSRIGDASYSTLRSAHERQVHLAVETAGGRLVKVMGDGTLSVFDAPARAVRCAATIREEAADLGLSVRAGVHTGEVERIGPDVAGMTVHIAARVAAAASPGEILVSGTVRDLVIGSGLMFEERGVRDLKGVPGSWSLYALRTVDRPAVVIDEAASMQTLADRAALAVARRAPRAMRTMMRVGNSIQRTRLRRDAAEPTQL